MNDKADEVYEGIRCAVCEERFTNRDVVAVLWDTCERRHYECPTTPEVVIDTPEIRVHPGEGWIAIRDRPDSSRPWAKVVPGISLTDEDVADWAGYPSDSRALSDHMMNQDDCLIAITDERPLPVKALQALPPYRAVLLTRVAYQAGGCLEFGSLEDLIAEADAVGGDGTLGEWWRRV